MAALTTSFVNMAWWPVVDTLFVPGRAWVGGWSFLPMQETLANLYKWYFSILVAVAVVGAVVAMRRRRSLERVATVPGGNDGALAGLAICAACGALHSARHDVSRGPQSMRCTDGR
jgi:hypothetical protein